MDNFTSIVLTKRFKSFLWRLANTMVIVGLSFIAENIAGLGWPLWASGLIGFITAEVTKFLNTRKKIGGKTTKEPSEIA